MVGLIEGDALLELSNLEKCSIDLAIIDPPYLLNKTTGGISKTGLIDKWQGNIKGSDKTASIMNNIAFSDWLPKVYDVLKEDSHCYIWTNDKNLSDLQVAAEHVGFRLHNILVWKKNNVTPNRWYMKNCEFILFLYKGKAKVINNKSSSQFFEVKNKSGKDKYHPTEKPVEILEELILNSSNEGDTVLDCFMGSGSTGVACKNLNRNFIGIEKDIKYYNISQSRIFGDGQVVK